MPNKAAGGPYHVRAMMLHGIHFDEAAISAFCRSSGIVRLSLFGSILRGDFDSASDVDVLVEFRPGETPSLFQLGGMQQELSAMFGREVDLKTPGFLSMAIRDHVARTASVQYAA